MRSSYDDITDRISEKPKWWDEHGAPRYSDPNADQSSNIYADRVGFFRVECQGCGEEFLVEMSDSLYSRRQDHPKDWHYGDPPNNGCCGVGATMNSIPREIVAFYETSQKTYHRRVTMRNVAIDCEWARPEPNEELAKRLDEETEIA